MFSLAETKRLFVYPVQKLCADYYFEVYGVSSMVNPKDHTIMFLTPKNLDEATGIKKCHNCLIFVPSDYEQYSDCNGHCIIKTDNPRRAYAKLVSELVSSEEKMEYEFKEGSWISPEAKIGSNVSIGPGCYIGAGVTIGDDCILYPGVKIHGPVTIGKRVIIRDNTVIGTQGFGFVEDENGERMRVPFLGDIIIEEDVEIGALCNIARGMVDTTMVRRSVKIDAMTFIAHDVYIDENTLLIGNRLAGHVNVGKNCYLGLGAMAKPRIKIGNGSKVGLGAAVVKNVGNGSTVAGVPAKEILRGGK